jgi:hypothetical protein
MEQHIQVQDKNNHFNNIWESIGDIDRWIDENTNATIELLGPSSIDRKLDLVVLNHYQQAGKREDKETTNSMEICSRLHKATQGLTRKCRLPPLEKLGNTFITEQLIEKVHQSTSGKKEVTESASKVMEDLIEHHLIQPTKVHTMIHAFMATLEKYMQTLSENTTMHKVALEELAYRWIISLYDHLEM